MQLHVQDLLNKMKRRSSEDDAVVIKAFIFSKEAHQGQTRFSGEEYFIHAYDVGLILAELGLDANTIAAGLLHDTVEDGHVTDDVIKKEFGHDICFLVQGVTKLGKLKYQGVERHAENLRRLFVAMSKDIRVLFIKLADRLHNVRTLEFVRPDKQHRIAVETIDIYARLADRLGLGKLKEELEDRSFPYAFPAEYKKVKELLHIKSKENRARLEKTYRGVKRELAVNNLADAKVNYRIKGIYSTFKKLREKGMDIEKIYDIAALRVILPTVEQCYQALGIIHSNWQPVPGRFKDYIATPKPNGYQSLHTTIFTGDGGMVEVQIRTHQMHEEAEYGIAAHFAYNELDKPQKGGVIHDSLAWVRQLLNWQKLLKNDSSEQYMEHLKTDIFRYQIFAFTPKGDVIELPEGSTPVDFAYSVHSEIGNKMVAAKVNNKIAPLEEKLNNGDVVEIITKKNGRPHEKWLDYAQAALTKRHIRQGLLRLKERPQLNKEK
ncbi:MAG: RelA/SpoT family protein [Candidatus Paceibacterota bacterium]|jgi:GTP pyrophosphokinase